MGQTINYKVGEYKNFEPTIIPCKMTITIKDLILKSFIICPHHKNYSLVKATLSLESDKTLGFGEYNMLFKKHFEKEVFVEDAVQSFVKDLLKFVQYGKLDLIVESEQLCIALESGADVDCNIRIEVHQ